MLLIILFFRRWCLNVLVSIRTHVQRMLALNLDSWGIPLLLSRLRLDRTWTMLQVVFHNENVLVYVRIHWKLTSPSKIVYTLARLFKSKGSSVSSSSSDLYSLRWRLRGLCWFRFLRTCYGSDSKLHEISTLKLWMSDFNKIVYISIADMHQVGLTECFLFWKIQHPSWTNVVISKLLFSLLMLFLHCISYKQYPRSQLHFNSSFRSYRTNIVLK